MNAWAATHETWNVLDYLSGLEWTLHIVKRLRFYPMWRLILDWYIDSLKSLRRRVMLLYECTVTLPTPGRHSYFPDNLALITKRFTALCRSPTVPRSVRRAVLPLRHQYFCHQLFLQRRVRAQCARWLPRDIWDMIGDYAYSDLRIFLKFVSVWHELTVYQMCICSICASMRVRSAS